MSHNHYQTLDVSPKATASEIKQAYRRLAKLFHPDSKSDADPGKIVEIIAAYEILGDPARRRSYDQQLQYSTAQKDFQNRQKRTAEAQQRYQRHRQSGQKADIQINEWLHEVYEPVNRLVSRIINSLDAQLDELSADPFDDDLMAEFQAYLDECRHFLNQAQLTFRSQPNPSTVAGAAASLYYCLNQLGDGIEELSLFTLNYDDHYLHTGQELFRIATSLCDEAQDAVKDIAY